MAGSVEDGEKGRGLERKEEMRRRRRRRTRIIEKETCPDKQTANSSEMM